MQAFSTIQRFTGLIKTGKFSGLFKRPAAGGRNPKFEPTFSHNLSVAIDRAYQTRTGLVWALNSHVTVSTNSADCAHESAERLQTPKLQMAAAL